MNTLYIASSHHIVNIADKMSTYRNSCVFLTNSSVRYRKTGSFSQLLRIFLLLPRCKALNLTIKLHLCQMSAEELGTRNFKFWTILFLRLLESATPLWLLYSTLIRTRCINTRVAGSHRGSCCPSRQQLIMVSVKNKQLHKFLEPSEEISSVVNAISKIFITPSKISATC